MTKEEAKSALSSFDLICHEFSHSLIDLLLDKGIVISGITARYSKDFSSSDFFFYIVVEFKRDETIGAMESIDCFLDDIQGTKEFMEKEFNHYLERISFGNDSLRLNFNIAKENILEHSLYKSLIAIEKYQL